MAPITMRLLGALAPKTERETTVGNATTAPPPVALWRKSLRVMDRLLLMVNSYQDTWRLEARA
jgi:hypothetical protein